MTKRSKAEIDNLIAIAEQERDSAPTLPAEDAARLKAKWDEDSLSLSPSVIEEANG